jgi:hypothetical protein
MFNYLITGATVIHVNDAKQINKSALQLLKCFCLEISQNNSKEALETVCKAVLSAAEFGNPETLEPLFSSFPGILSQEETVLHSKTPIQMSSIYCYK